jgi:hypothetical protein
MKVRVRPRILDARKQLRASRDRCQDAGNRRGRFYAFTSLTPIKPGSAAAVDLELRRYETGPSPFRNLPEVHAARLVVIDQLKTGWFGAPDPRPQLRSQYVLFTADIIAPYDGYALPDQFLERMYVSLRAEVHTIWGQCYGFATARTPMQFASWLKRSQLDTSLYFVGYPDATPEELSEALQVRDELIEFVRTHQYLNRWDTIWRAYLTRGAAWFP